MAIDPCPTHNLPQHIICCQGPCLRRYCQQCFFQHNEQHNTGITLNLASKNSLIQWNQYLIQKFKEILANIHTKGMNALFEMKLVPSYPKGLMNQISNGQIVEVSGKVIEEYLMTLATNVEFISSRESLNELDIPELFKDIFIFFVYDATKGLNFLAERVQAELKTRFPEKKMYEFVYFTFVPKEMRVIQIKRKAIVKTVEDQVVVQLRKDNKLSSPSLGRSKISDREKGATSPSISGERYTPRSYGEGNVLGNTCSFGENQDAIKQPHRVEMFQANYQKIEPQNLFSRTEQPKQQERIQIKFQKQPQFFIPNPIQQSQQQKPLQQHLVTIESEQPQSTQPHLIRQLSQKNNELLCQIENLEGKLKQKQRSLRELNNLIGNEEQQLLYRQNQVQILTQQIRKLIFYKTQSEALQQQLAKTRAQLEFKQKSIATLTDLIGNEEQEIITRENQVETLTIQIKKLVEWKQRCQEIEAKLTEKERELDEREKGIKELNNIIDNEEEQLISRQSQVQTLNSDLKKANEAKTHLEDRLQTLTQQNKMLYQQIYQFQTIIKTLQSQQQQQPQQSQKMIKEEQQNFDEQLMQQVIELESEVVSRNEDIKKLLEVVNRLKGYMPEGEDGDKIRGILKEVKAIKYGN